MASIPELEEIRKNQIMVASLRTVAQKGYAKGEQACQDQETDCVSQETLLIRGLLVVLYLLSRVRGIR